MSDTPPSPGLCIVVETGPGDEALLARIAAAAAAHPATIVLAAAAGATLEARVLHPAIEHLQTQGIAVLIENEPALARTLKADGVHLAWSKDIVERYEEAREILGTRFMAGADAGRSRHDAMTLGEGGADYVAFGIPAHVEDRATAAERRLDLVAWWAEIFEVPVVAFDVANGEEASDLAAAGADFIALRFAPQASPDIIARELKLMASAMSMVPAEAGDRT